MSCVYNNLLYGYGCFIEKYIVNNIYVCMKVRI